MVKRPAFMFYPSDWRNDLPLRTCSIAARGLWQELLVTMHQGTPYGHLALEGVPLSDEEAAALAGVTGKDYRKLLAELERRRVFSRTDAGVIYSRRMVRDEATRLARAAGGEEGKAHGAKGAPHGAKGGRPPKAKGGSETPLAGSGEPPFNPPPSFAVAVSLADAVSSSLAAAAASELPAAAPAAASGGHDAEAYGQRRDAIRARFTDERHVLAFDRHCRASQFPDAFLLDVEAAARPRPSDGADGIPWDVIGTALHELQVKGRRATEHLIRAFAQPMLSARSERAGERQPTEAELEADFLRRIEAGEFLPTELREAPV